MRRSLHIDHPKASQMLANSPFTIFGLLPCWLVKVSLLLAVIAGCQDSGPNRVHVSGTVTWKGQKVPAGYVTLSPDVAKGNSGPQGIAKIIDGRFDTRSEGRPAVSGAMQASVGGFDGVNTDEDNHYGNAIFPRAFMSVTIPEGSVAELNIEVPSN
jgi:hypothetical protein